MAGLARRPAAALAAPHCRRHRSPGGGDCPSRVLGYRAANALHEQGGGARRRELPLLRRPGAGSGQWPLPARRASSELHVAAAYWPGGGHHALEYAVHAVDLEDCAGLGGGLHGGPQTSGMEPVERPTASRDLPRGRAAARRSEHGAGCWRSGWPGVDRAAVRQGGGFRRRVRHRQPHHGPRGRNPEAGAF